jgi:ParB family transcriptional regulator, chromosome partitioning protein
MAKKVKKKELGLGIKALLSNIDHKAEENPELLVRELSNTIAFIGVAMVEVNPFQPRKEFDEASLKELSESLKVHGLIQPITVRRLDSKHYQLISGERRLRAAKLAGLDEIPAYIRIADDQEMLEMALVENIQREQLNAIEVAITYKRLIDECKLTHEELSERVGKNRTSVTNFLRLLKLPPEIQQALKLKLISMGHARSLVGIDNILLQNALFKETIEKELSVRALEKLIRDSAEPKTKKAAKPALSDDYQDVENQLKSYLEAKVELKLKGKGKGHIIIHFDSDETLNNVLEKIEK